MHHLKIPFSVLLLTFLLPIVTNAGLPPEVMKDKYLMELSGYLKNEQFNDALPYFDKLRALKKKHKLTLPSSLIYFEGEALFHTGQYFKSDELLTTYVTQEGTKGPYYAKALEFLIVLDKKKEEQLRIQQREAEERRIAEEKERQKQDEMKVEQRKLAMITAEEQRRQQEELSKLPTGTIADGFVLIPSGSFQMGSNDYNYTKWVKPILLQAEAKEQERLTKQVTILKKRGISGEMLATLQKNHEARWKIIMEFVNISKPEHQVQLKAFAMNKFEVTFTQYDEFCKARKYSCNLPKTYDNVRGERAVYNITWREATNYAKWLSKKLKKKFRLPSEAEWEYAARAGTNSVWSWGNNEERADTYAWYQKNSSGGVQAVGQKKPNAYGLYDMFGNVWEWTKDCWNDNYIGAPSNGKAWKKGNCKQHIMRGGSYNATFLDLAPNIRFRTLKDASGYNFGFRLVQEIE